MRTFLILGFAAFASASQQKVTRNAANPIRKVINMMQMMQKKVQEEGEKEKALFEKFMCYCKTGDSQLEKSIAEAKSKVPDLHSRADEIASQISQLDGDIKQAEVDSAASKNAMAEATAIRQKDAKTFAHERAENEANLKAIKKAVASLTDGKSTNFLQSRAAKRLIKALSTSQDMIEVDRQALLSFMTDEQSEDTPQASEAVGMLKQLKTTIVKSTAAANSDEQAAIKTYNELIAAKQKEVSALQVAIEAKTVRVGELGVTLTQVKEDLDDTEAALDEDIRFLKDLESNCGTKQKEWEVIQKTRSGELTALGDTIKILNDDEALDLFKKTLPGSSASFMQVRVTAAEVRSRALAVLRAGQHRRNHHKQDQTYVDLIELALHGRKVSFDKVNQKVDNMITELKKEQANDDSKKQYCTLEIDTVEDKIKTLDQSVTDTKAVIEDAKNAVSTIAGDMASLEAAIVALDKEVKEATEQRKKEHQEYQELMASNAAAKQLLIMAKNRLHKFYNPGRHEPPVAPELLEEDETVLAMNGDRTPLTEAGADFVQLQSRSHTLHKHMHKDLPPPPAAASVYKKRSKDSGGVIAMMDTLVRDITTQMVEADAEEKSSQKAYEQMMKDSAEKRVSDTKMLEVKSSAKADMESHLHAHKAKKTATSKEVLAALKVMESLHSECDWLLKVYDERKEGRAGEIDSLQKAQSILNGADYSLLQQAHNRRTLTLGTHSSNPSSTS